MARILVVFESRYGSTKRIAERVARQLETDGHQVTLLSGLDAVQAPVDVDAVILAAPVYLGRHPRNLYRFVRRRVSFLNLRRCGFISVCGSLGGQWAKGPAEARHYVERFLESTGWQPEFVLSVAGTIAYTRYDLVTRWIMRRISSWTGRPTDTTRDHELTNWADVDRFAAQFSALLAPPVPASCYVAP